MKKILLAAVSGALLLGCSSDKTVVNGRIEGYNGEFTEFFLPDSTVEGGFREIVVEVNEDGTFTAEFDLPESYYDAPFFVDKFMFRTCIEKGKTYEAWFDVTKPGVETGFGFTGEGAAENEFTRDWWNGFGLANLFISEYCDEVSDFASYKAAIRSQADVFRARLDTVGNAGFTAYYAPLIDKAVDSYSFYYP